MKIYTRTGDHGQTSLIGGRADKDDVRVEAYGTVDELNCFVGQAVSWMADDKYADLKTDMVEIMHELFDCGYDLALASGDGAVYKVTAEMVDRLERLIDRYDAQTPAITRFILPGGSPVSAALHVCRTVCRRAERRVVALAKAAAVNEQAVRYLNRLSDFLFTAARAANVREGVADVEYVRSAEVFRNK